MLSLIGSVGAALTLGLRGSGVLISILVLPLYIPVLIFGAGGSRSKHHGDESAVASFICYVQFSVLSLIFAPWATAAALRISLE